VSKRTRTRGWRARYRVGAVIWVHVFCQVLLQGLLFAFVCQYAPVLQLWNLFVSDYYVDLNSPGSWRMCISCPLRAGKYVYAQSICVLRVEAVCSWGAGSWWSIVCEPSFSISALRFYDMLYLISKSLASSSNRNNGHHILLSDSQLFKLRPWDDACYIIIWVPRIINVSKYKHMYKPLMRYCKPFGK